MFAYVCTQRRQDVQRARDVVADHVWKTPLLTFEVLKGPNYTIYVKCENLQRVRAQAARVRTLSDGAQTGSFKARGALNAILSLKEKRPVVTHSSGNHAQAVAFASRIAGVEAHLVVPSNAPKAGSESPGLDSDGGPGEDGCRGVIRRHCALV